MHTKLTRLAVVIAAAAGVSTSAFAITPQDVRISDGLAFTPTLKLEQRHDDNIFATNKNRKSSWVTVVEPTFTLSLDRAKSAHQLQYRLSSKNFQSMNSSSYIDHHLTADTGFEFNSRNRLLLNAGYHKLEDTMSDYNYSGIKAKNDKWNTKNVGGVYTYGARTARTQLDLGLNYSELRYDNSGTVDGVRLNKNSERDAASARVTGYYSIAPKTRLLLEGRYTDYDYTSASDRDSKNKAGVVWAPLTYSVFTLKTRRGFDEGSYAETSGDLDLENIDNVTSSIRTVDTSLGWKHYWMDRLYSDAQYRRIDRKYQRVSRDDKIDQYGLGLTYEARRWLDIGVGFTHRENDSDIKTNSYTRNIYAITFNASL